MAPRQDRSSYLLLLPPPPQPVTYESLKAAFRLPISTVLKKLAAEIRNADAGVVLDIALPMPHLLQDQQMSRGALYAKTQTLLAGIYKLICVVAAKEKINVEDESGIDVRVLMLAHDKGTDGSATSQNTVDTVISLETLAQSQRGWDYVIAVESEEGEEMLRQFSVFQDDRLKINRVPGGTVFVLPDSAEEAATDNAEAGTNHLAVIVGGTFDHIHIGHKLLLAMFAFILVGQESQGDATRSLTIGITNDELLKDKKYADLLESWDKRQSVVLDFLRAIMDFRPEAEDRFKLKHLSDPGPNGHAVHAWLGPQLVIKCVEIGDPFGPTITVQDLSALAISAETRSGGKAVNEKRKEKGWAELEVFEVDVLDAEEDVDGREADETFQAKLSSTTIRKALSERAQMKSKV